MAGFRIEGNTSGNVAEVNTANELRTTGGSQTLVNAGYNACIFENDAGTLTGTPYRKSPLVSEDSRLNVGMDTPMFDYSFNATAQNTAIWRFSAGTTTMAATSASGFLTLNSGSVLTTQAACALSTWRSFPLRGNASQHGEITINISATPVGNQVFEIGNFFLTATGAAPTAPADGIWFQLTSAGLIGVMNYNGTVTQSGTLVAAASIPLATNKVIKMIVSEGVVEYWYGGVLAGEIPVPAGNSQPFLTTSLPLTFQVRNTGTVTGTPCLMRISDAHVDQNDLNLNKPYSVQQNAMGLSIYQGQDGGTMGTTATLPNATAATTVTGAALAQATSLVAGLGGQVGITATVPGVDGQVTAYLNPVGGVNQTPRTMIITGVKISSVNIGAAVATTPSTIQWSIAFGHNAIALTTAEGATFTSPTTKAPRRIPIGIQSWIVGAALGAPAADIIVSFAGGEIVVNPGEYISSVCKFIQGTATASQVIWTNVTFIGYEQ